MPPKNVERCQPRRLHREKPRRAGRRLHEAERADDKFAEEIKTLENALDSHSTGNRKSQRNKAGSLLLGSGRARLFPD
jgi:hypothetical protein